MKPAYCYNFLLYKIATRKIKLIFGFPDNWWPNFSQLCFNYAWRLLALCSMLHPTNYTKNYARILGAGLLRFEMWWCHTDLSEIDDFQLVDHLKIIAEMNTATSEGLDLNEVVLSSYNFKWIRLNWSWHDIYVTCKCYPVKIPDRKVFVNSMIRPSFWRAEYSNTNQPHHPPYGLPEENVGGSSMCS